MTERDKEERVARAIYRARFSPGYWGGVDSTTRDMYLDMARAALKEVSAHGEANDD